MRIVCVRIIPLWVCKIMLLLFFNSWGTHGKQLTDASSSFVYSWILITIMTYHENLCLSMVVCLVLQAGTSTKEGCNGQYQLCYAFRDALLVMITLITMDPWFPARDPETPSCCTSCRWVRWLQKACLKRRRSWEEVWYKTWSNLGDRKNGMVYSWGLMMVLADI